MSYDRDLFNQAPPPKKDKRTRFQFRFWLNAQNDTELLLCEDIDNLKRGRTFQTTVRDALRLILDLRQGRADVLRVLFPHVVRAIETEARAHVDTLANAEFAALIADAITRQTPPGTAYPRPALPAPELVISERSTTDAGRNFLSSLTAFD